MRRRYKVKQAEAPLPLPTIHMIRLKRDGSIATRCMYVTKKEDRLINSFFRLVCHSNVRRCSTDSIQQCYNIAETTPKIRTLTSQFQHSPCTVQRQILAPAQPGHWLWAVGFTNAYSALTARQRYRQRIPCSKLCPPSIPESWRYLMVYGSLRRPAQLIYNPATW